MKPMPIMAKAKHIPDANVGYSGCLWLGLRLLGMAVLAAGEVYDFAFSGVLWQRKDRWPAWPNLHTVRPASRSGSMFVDAYE